MMTNGDMTSRVPLSVGLTHDENEVQHDLTKKKAPQRTFNLETARRSEQSRIRYHSHSYHLSYH